MDIQYNNFEDALKELKSIVSELENNENISLEELVKNYESGLSAYKYCYNKLEEAQKKIKFIESEQS